MNIHANTAPMNWDLAIERNREALLRILAALVALLPEGDATTQITRRLHSAILFVLRPAESAVRRLIVVAASRMPSRPAAPLRVQVHERVTAPSQRSTPNLRSNTPRNSAFPLCDQLKRFGDNSGPKTRRDACPNIWFPGAADRAVPSLDPEPHAEDLINAAPVIRRLKRLQQALGDIPGEAKRLMTSRARRQRVIALRPGAPPGHRKRHRHEVDDILSECQWLAREALDGQLPPTGLSASDPSAPIHRDTAPSAGPFHGPAR